MYVHEKCIGHIYIIYDIVIFITNANGRRLIISNNKKFTTERINS